MATYTIQDSDEVLLVSAATYDSVTLPPSTGAGRIIYVKNIYPATISVIAAGTDRIDSASAKTLEQWDCAHLFDGAVGLWVLL